MGIPHFLLVDQMSFNLKQKRHGHIWTPRLRPQSCLLLLEKDFLIRVKNTNFYLLVELGTVMSGKRAKVYLPLFP